VHITGSLTLNIQVLDSYSEDIRQAASFHQQMPILLNFKAWALKLLHFATEAQSTIFNFWHSGAQRWAPECQK